MLLLGASWSLPGLPGQTLAARTAASACLLSLLLLLSFGLPAGLVSFGVMRAMKQSQAVYTNT